MVRKRRKKYRTVKYRFCSEKNIPEVLRPRLSRLSYGKNNGVMWHWLRGYNKHCKLDPEARTYVVYAYYPCRKSCKGCRRCTLVGWSVMQGYPEYKSPNLSVYISKRYRGKGYARELVHRVLNYGLNYVWVGKIIRASSYGFKQFPKIVSTKGYQCRDLYN